MASLIFDQLNVYKNSLYNKTVLRKQSYYNDDLNHTKNHTE